MLLHLFAENNHAVKRREKEANFKWLDLKLIKAKVKVLVRLLLLLRLPINNTIYIDIVIPDESCSEKRQVEKQHTKSETARFFIKCAMQEPDQEDQRLPVMIAVCLKKS